MSGAGDTSGGEASRLGDFAGHTGRNLPTAARRTLTALALGDAPEAWEALGFAVVEGRVELDGVALELGPEAGPGIRAWSLPAVDGLAGFTASRAVGAPATHPNGAIGLDHVVVLSPDFDRTAAALEAASMPLRRVRDAGGFRQGFRRVGPAILELVEARGEDAGAPARFWGLVVIVYDLDALKERLGAVLSEPKPAVQPGRRIATLSARSGLGQAVAFMDPDSPVPDPGRRSDRLLS